MNRNAVHTGEAYDDDCHCGQRRQGSSYRCSLQTALGNREYVEDNRCDQPRSGSPEVDVETVGTLRRACENDAQFCCSHSSILPRNAARLLLFQSATLFHLWRGVETLVGGVREDGDG